MAQIAERISQMIDAETLRIPFQGYIDLTYRCNLDCLHCWLKVPSTAAEEGKELGYEEIVRIVSAARKLGCREWVVSGGEPLLRPDFPDIFKFITDKCRSYTLNTNGTLITPAIATLLKRDGVTLVALYGADAKAHDAITRQPGSFSATLRGMNLLKEAGVNFIVQIVPMRDNFHQFHQMVDLALSVCPKWRLGATWLHLSADGDENKNREIIAQRLSPEIVAEIDGVDMSDPAENDKELNRAACGQKTMSHLLEKCISTKKDFHIDPYGQMAFCSLVKDPQLRYDLRQGDFHTGWESFIPSLVNQIVADKEYQQNCAVCKDRDDCRCCPVHAYLEHRRFSAKVEYLCAVAESTRQARERKERENRRYYQVAGLTIQVDSDLPLTDTTFIPQIRQFEVKEPGDEIIRFWHHFHLPDLSKLNLGKKVFEKSPWLVFRHKRTWIYMQCPTLMEPNGAEKVAIFNDTYSRAHFYHAGDFKFRNSNFSSLALFPSDQIVLTLILAEKKACIIHASGLVFNGKGFLFVGHSEAGKSTISKMLMARGGTILCDDRIIVRQWPEGYRIHGNWSHGEIPDVSPAEAPLVGVFFLEKAMENKLLKLDDPKAILKKLFPFLIKSFVSADWWEKMLKLFSGITADVPCYSLRFDQSGKIVDLLERF